MYHTDKAQAPKHEFQKSSGDTKSTITMTVAIQPYRLLFSIFNRYCNLRSLSDVEYRPVWADYQSHRSKWRSYKTLYTLKILVFTYLKRAIRK